MVKYRHCDNVTLRVLTTPHITITYNVDVKYKAIIAKTQITTVEKMLNDRY